MVAVALEGGSWLKTWLVPTHYAFDDEIRPVVAADASKPDEPSVRVPVLRASRSTWIVAPDSIKFYVFEQVDRSCQPMESP